MTNTPLQQAQLIASSLKNISAEVTTAQSQASKSNKALVATLKGLAGNVGLTQSEANTLITMLNTGTPPAPTYPQSIINAGLQSVWDLQTTAGATGALAPVNPASLPAGVTIGQDPNGPGGAAPANTIIISGNVDMPINTDYSGYNWAANGNYVVRLSNSKLSFPGAVSSGPYKTIYWLALGQLGGTTLNFSFANCTVDFTSFQNGNTCLVGPGVTISSTGSRYINAPADFIVAMEGSHGTWTGNYFTFPGANATVGDHLETIHFTGNPIGSQTITFNGNFIDWRGCGGIIPPNTVTGALDWEPEFGNMTGTMNGNIVIGVAAGGGFYTMQAGRGGGNTTNLSVNGNVFEKGLSGYLANNGGVTVSQSNNLDYATGLPITI